MADSGERVRVRDFCHPQQSKRTKCVCGHVLTLAGAYGDTVAVCKCGRKHRKKSGSPFFSGPMGPDGRGLFLRPGGKAGCPGLDESR